MKIYLRRILKALGITVATLLTLAIIAGVALAAWLRTDAARQQVLQISVDMLREKLQTEVSVDSVSIELLKGQVRIYDVRVNDRDDSLLVSMEQLHVGIAPSDLLDRRVRVTDVELYGADARLWKDSLTNNFQFVIDAFKKKNKDTDKRKTRKPGKLKLEVDVKDVLLKNMHVRWDVRHKLRKNIVNPRRGAFDANHLDAMLNLKATVRQPDSQTYSVTLKELSASDKPSGLQVDELSARAIVSKEKIDVEGIMLNVMHSRVQMEPFTIDLKKKEIPRPFTLKAYVLLQDIARPFAPALSNFTTPLLLTTQVSGPLRSLNVEDILVQTPDGHLTLTARGCMDGLFGKKENMHLTFSDIDLNATHSMKEQIVMHFAKKMRLKMIRQMKAVGDIRFKGSLEVLYKKEIIAGRLSTRFGDVRTRFAIDGKTKYMTGYLETSSLEMGKLMNIKQLGPVKCHIDFHFNLSRKTPRPATALPHGRLPMGELTAKVYDARFSTIMAQEVDVVIHSDGSTANGYLKLPRVHDDISLAQFRYVQTDTRQDIWFSLTRGAQQWVLDESVGLLKEKLHAEVAADSINLRLFDGDARLYGIRVKDLHDNPLFSLDTLSVSFNAQELLQHTVHITHLGLYGLDAQLNKDSLSANFRFVIDTFKKKKNKKNVVPQKKKKMQLVMDLEEISVENMHLKWDVKDKPRKNQGNPRKAAFDANHLDMVINLHASFRQDARGAYVVELKDMSIDDIASGLQMNNMRARASLHNGMLHVDDLYIQLPQSWVSAEPLTLNIKDMRFVKPFMVQADVVLQDIAVPFAPVLNYFTTPLHLKAMVGGTITDMQVEDIEVTTPDDGLLLTADGLLKGITQKKDSLSLQFRDVELQAGNEKLLKMVMHFARTVRLKMVRQLQKIGDVHFAGDVDIMDKRERFAGQLDTEYGTVETQFTLDGTTHIMTGFLDSPALDIGKFLNLKRLKPIDTHIDFDFNISAHAPRPETALPNGRLPQGRANAIIHGVKYGWLHAKTIEATVSSDGSTATGSVCIPRIVSDLIVHFNYIQTDEQQHMKFRPAYKFHPLFKRRKSKK